MTGCLLVGAALAADPIVVQVQAGNVPSVEPITVHLRAADGSVRDVVVTDDGRGDDAVAEDTVWTGSGTVTDDRVHVSLTAGTRLFPEADARWTEPGDRTLRLVVKGRELEVHADVSSLRVGAGSWETGLAALVGLLVVGAAVRQGRGPARRPGVRRLVPPGVLDGSRLPRGRVRVDDPATAAGPLADALAATHTVFWIGDGAPPAAAPGRIVRAAPDPDRLPALLAVRDGEALAVVVQAADDEADEWEEAAARLPAGVACFVLVAAGGAGPELQLGPGAPEWASAPTPDPAPPGR